MPHKAFVEVNVHYDTEGNMTPLSLVWEDGRTYEIDRVLDCRRVASMKAGGTGLRYTCEIEGKLKYLWYEGPSWFVEAK